MKTERFKLLYVYKERIPDDLQKLVLDSFSEGEFLVDRMTYNVSDEEKSEKMHWADGVLFAPGRYLPESIFRSAQHIKLMQLWSSGFDKFNIEAAKKYGIPVSNNGGANAISVAEHAIMLMLAIYKWLPDSHSRAIEGNWAGNSHGMDMFLLHKKTLGIIGFGNIGREVARRASGFGMKVIYYDPVRAASDVEKITGAEYSDFNSVLSNTDILTLHLHLNDATEGLIGKKELDLMKNTVVVINVSRAGLIDNKELLNALESGQIWGVGLDVYDTEPTKPKDPLLTHPHVIATPHMAGSTYDAYVMAMENCVDNFRRVIAGEKPLWVVNGVE